MEVHFPIREESPGRLVACGCGVEEVCVGAYIPGTMDVELDDPSILDIP